jgi:hypothetical protein
MVLMEAHFKHFCVQLANSLSASLWKVIFNFSGLSWPNRSQKASGNSFSEFLGSASQIGLRMALEGHFKHFWAQLAESLSGGLQKVNLSISGLG